MHHDSEPVGTLIEKVNAMSLEELEAQLPLAQNSLESIELEFVGGGRIARVRPVRKVGRERRGDSRPPLI